MRKNSINICSQQEFAKLRKDITKCARVFLPKNTKITFKTFEYDGLINETGYTEQKSKYVYEIGIASGMSSWYTGTMIIHELAHVIHTANGDQGPVHGSTYWKWHGKLYCEYIGDD